MANPGYVRFSDGDDADDGSTWALANKTAAGAITDAAVGDRIWFSHAHDESTASAVSLTFPGTYAAPNELVCGNDGVEPPTASAITAHIRTSGASSISINGSFYARGLNFHAGSSTLSANINVGTTVAARQVYTSCSFELVGSSASNRIVIFSALTAADTCSVEWRDCDIKFSNVAQGLILRNVDFLWRGGGVLAGSAVTTFISDIGASAARGGTYKLIGLDLTQVATTCSLLLPSTGSPCGSYNLKFIGCIMPTSWTGQPTSAAFVDPGQRVEMHRCMKGTTPIPLWVRDYFGDITYDTGIYRAVNGGADGTTPYSLKMTTAESNTNGANCQWPWGSLDWPSIADVPGIPVWVDSTGSKFFTVDLLVDSASPWRNTEFVIEVAYLGTSADHDYYSFSRSDPATVITADAALETGAGLGSWTGYGAFANAMTLKAVASATIAKVGYHFVRLRLYKPSATVWVDPTITVT